MLLVVLVLHILLPLLLSVVSAVFSASSASSSRVSSCFVPSSSAAFLLFHLPLTAQWTALLLHPPLDPLPRDLRISNISLSFFFLSRPPFHHFFHYLGFSRGFGVRCGCLHIENCQKINVWAFRTSCEQHEVGKANQGGICGKRIDSEGWVQRFMS